MNKTNHTYQESPNNFFSFSTEGTIGKSEPADFFYVKDNHLGSVLTVVSDRKLAVDANSDGIVDYYLADVVSSNDYYSGIGMVMPGRSFSSSSYRYGAQGSEVDEEIEGDRNHITTFYREGNLENLRWWSPDPNTKNSPWESPYVWMGNNPVKNNDVMGDEDNEKGADKKQKISIGVDVNKIIGNSQGFSPTQPDLTFHNDNVLRTYNIGGKDVTLPFAVDEPASTYGLTVKFTLKNSAVFKVGHQAVHLKLDRFESGLRLNGGYTQEGVVIGYKSRPFSIGKISNLSMEGSLSFGGMFSQPGFQNNPLEPNYTTTTYTSGDGKGYQHIGWGSTAIATISWQVVTWAAFKTSAILHGDSSFNLKNSAGGNDKFQSLSGSVSWGVDFTIPTTKRRP